MLETQTLYHFWIENELIFKNHKKICRNETNNEMFFSEFHDCFGEIGPLNTTHQTEGKIQVQTSIYPLYKVPLVLKPKLEKELK